jgi:tetratricopeptide (TPR) repeat protein
MSSPNQSIADRFPWLTRARAISCAFAVVLLIVFIWPSARLVADLVVVTAIPGLIGAVVWALTFWPKARVELERRQFQSRAVRRVAGIIALTCLPFLLMQRASIYLRNPRELVSEGSGDYPDISHWRIRVVVAIANLEGDEGAKIAGQLRDALAGIDHRLHITAVILNRRIAVAGRPQGIAHLEAMGAVTDVRVDSLIWGGVKGATHPAVGPLYQTRYGGAASFGNAYLPADFKLPELPVDDLCAVMRLMIASQTASEMLPSDFKFGDALEPLIKQVRALSEDSRKTADWSADTRARVNLVLGIASTVSGSELKSEDAFRNAIAYFDRTQSGWTRERGPLEWAMAQRKLGSALIDLSELNMQEAPVQAAATAYQNALAVYQSRSDRLDSANVQLELGDAFQKIGGHENGADSLRRSADYYRAAAKGFDVRYYPVSWAEAQRNLAETLDWVAQRDASAKEYEEAIAAGREALKVYQKQSSPIYWAGTLSEVAVNLEQLGELNASQDDLKQAITLDRQILDGYPREHNPVLWAVIQTDLGRALVELHLLNKDPACAEQAAAACRAALEVLSIERDPSYWASAKAMLGNALLALGDNRSDTYYAEQAVDAYNEALKVVPRDSSPAFWAWTKYDLAGALVELGERSSDDKYLKQAVDAYRETLTECSKDKMPDLWVKAQNDLKTALDDLHRRGLKGG